MANYDTLKNTLQSNVYQNSNNAVTGAILQNVLMAFINTMGTGSNFMGFLSAANKPTGTVDGKQFYIGYNASTTALSIDLSAVGLGTLSITRSKLYVVHNIGGTWAAVDINEGVMSILGDTQNVLYLLSMTYNEETRTRLVHQQGVCLVGISDNSPAFPFGLLSADYDHFILIEQDGNPSRIITNDLNEISISRGTRLWLNPNNNSNEWERIGILNQEENPICNIFVPHCGLNFETAVSQFYLESGYASPEMTPTQIQHACGIDYCFVPEYLYDTYRDYAGASLEEHLQKIRGGEPEFIAVLY